MKLSDLGREGLLDDTKPILNEESIFNKLQNNDIEIQKNPTEFYKKLANNNKGEIPC